MKPIHLLIPGALAIFALALLPTARNIPPPDRPCEHNGLLTGIDYAQTWAVDVAPLLPDGVTGTMHICKRCGRGLSIKKYGASFLSNFPISGEPRVDWGPPHYDGHGCRYDKMNQVMSDWTLRNGETEYLHPVVPDADRTLFMVGGIQNTNGRVIVFDASGRLHQCIHFRIPEPGSCLVLQGDNDRDGGPFIFPRKDP